MENHESKESCNKTYDIISSKVSALNNRVRFAIIEILSDIERKNQVQIIKKEPLYSRELNALLLEHYNINISPQMLGQHLKQLENADLVEEKEIRKEIPNKVGSRIVKAYKINTAAFKDLFLDIDLFRQELLSLFEIYEKHQKNTSTQKCTLTILNGPDKGKTFKISKEDLILVGRKENNYVDDKNSMILLDEGYCKVSSITKPHLKLYYHEDKWTIEDTNSEYGTYIDDKTVPKNMKTTLKNNCFLRLARGTGGIVFYCSY
ncbi:FHA domain-containing protein [Methanosphaera sp. ISO3-F5]|uniref:FHA domain-containing protein n=1 Tax=Methanosphaera sp. ISO3-F5 TaxID=1452353 RepID=UPI002B263EB6|nr:FHA domain-containing protein [Methanosphaera sp. ISO3-F5]WQH63788.1 FHA domain-containing protein [Methanosphaera sp. ISO3-F5]